MRASERCAPAVALIRKIEMGNSTNSTTPATSASETNVRRYSSADSAEPKQRTKDNSQDVSHSHWTAHQGPYQRARKSWVLVMAAAQPDAAYSNAAQSSAAFQVFAMPKLFEMIALNLDIKGIIALYGTTTSFAPTICCSTSLLKKLYLILRENVENPWDCHIPVFLELGPNKIKLVPEHSLPPAPLLHKSDFIETYAFRWNTILFPKISDLLETMYLEAQEDGSVLAFRLDPVEEELELGSHHTCWTMVITNLPIDGAHVILAFHQKGGVEYVILRSGARTTGSKVWRYCGGCAESCKERTCCHAAES